MAAAGSQMSQGRRLCSAVITGMGVVAANGTGLDAFWHGITAGHSAARPMTRFDVSWAPTQIAAQIEDFDGTRYMSALRARRMDRSQLYGVAAARMAFDDAAFDDSAMNPELAGVVAGTGLGPFDTMFDTHQGFLRRGYHGVGVNALVSLHNGALATEIAHHLGIHGHAVSLGSSSASGNDAIGYALRMIQHGEAEVMVAGGAEAPLTPIAWAALCLNKVLSRRNDAPKSAMRPFDRDRNGVLLGEGAAFVILEEKAHALARGARIYCEVLSQGRSCEAYHSTAPAPDGRGPHRAMAQALEQAGQTVEDVDYINAHGTATRANDAAEVLAIQRLWGSSRHRAESARPSRSPVTCSVRQAPWRPS
jgi:3-oxoacyl-[acyl-carrier-protein] synthase II